MLKRCLLALALLAVPSIAFADVPPPESEVSPPLAETPRDEAGGCGAAHGGSTPAAFALAPIAALLLARRRR